MVADWSFYGRTEPLAELTRIVDAGRWFFCRIDGRRRIGKTTLLSQLAKTDDALAAKLIYMQVPDSDERDVAATFRRSLSECELVPARDLAEVVTDFASMARAIGMACRAGAFIVLDEFQYFTRAKLRSFNSFLQAEVDKLRTEGAHQGGLFVLGSLHSEMNALLDDNAVPLYGRITARLRLDHWDFQDLMAVLRSQGVEDPRQWLTLWTFFEGVPKFYHDAYEQELFEVGPDDLAKELLARMFVRGSSPLSEEADTWFLRELRGKAVSVLHYLADHAGCTHAELVAALNDPDDRTPLGTHIARLVSTYGMVEKLQPVFSKPNSRNARYYVTDNFLQAWLAVAKPAREAARMRTLEKALAPAVPRLETLEGFAFERLVRRLHVEMSRKGLGDFELSELMLGYWNRAKDVDRSIEIDLVAIDRPNRRIRFGSCKRFASAHDRAAIAAFENHVSGFLVGRRELADWHHEKVVFSPAFTQDQRDALAGQGYGVKDLLDYASMV